MKKLYFHYYTTASSPEPFESVFICVDNCGNKERYEAIQINLLNISLWMKDHPEGKVEIKWE